MLQELSALSMTWAARWYAASAAAGIPPADAPARTSSAEPLGTPGAISPGVDTLAGALMALAGTFARSGSLRCWASADAERVTVRLAVQAPDSRASGTSADAFWK